MPHISFAGNMVIPRSIIALPVNIRKVPHQVVYMIDLVIMDCMDANNIILGRPFLVRTKAVISMHYPAMRILTSDKVITIKEDQQSARGCYSVISKPNYQTDLTLFRRGTPPVWYYIPDLLSEHSLDDGELYKEGLWRQLILLRNKLSDP